MVGDIQPAGAFEIHENYSSGDVVDLEIACEKSQCPSVIVFSGSQQWGTLNLVNCRVGQMYFFVNRSKMDLGIVVQQLGGEYGSKPIGRFDIGNCFCLTRRMYDEAGGDEDGQMDMSNVLACR